MGITLKNNKPVTKNMTIVEAQNGSGAGNALTKPTTAPSSTQLVAVDNTNTQTMLNIGDGLSVENGSLKASGGGSSSFFHHHISLDTQAEVLGTKFSIAFDFINNSQAPITKSNFFNSIVNFRTIGTGMYFQIESAGQSTKQIVVEIIIHDSVLNISAFDPNSSEIDLIEYNCLDEDSIGYTAVSLEDRVYEI